MSSQLVDLNGDGHMDILAGSFSGTPQIVMGGEDGYEASQPILDKEEQIVLISDFWNKEDKKWDETDRCQSTGHCTSSSAVDWDNDGDLDLVLGDYYGGKLFLRLNEGSKTEPKFATTNSAILAKGEPIVIEKGLAAPCVVDWNGDGKFDLLCGGSKGGVYYFKNIGDKGLPKFAKAEVLLEVVDKKGSFIGQVPSFQGQPTQPGSSYHIEACDYDGDGDLDLLVGGRSKWEKATSKASPEEKQKLAKLEATMQAARDAWTKAIEGMEKEAAEAFLDSKEGDALMQKFRDASDAFLKLNGKLDPSTTGEFVWLFRRK